MGPCLTEAAPEAAPGELFVEEAATRRPEHQPQRSLRQSASVVSSPPLSAHDVGLPASEPTSVKVVLMMPLVKYRRLAHCVVCCDTVFPRLAGLVRPHRRRGRHDGP